MRVSFKMTNVQYTVGITFCCAFACYVYETQVRPLFVRTAMPEVRMGDDNVTRRTPNDTLPSIVDYAGEQTGMPDVIYITNGTMKQPDQNWMATGDLSFKGCPNLEAWMKCSYNPNTLEAYNQSEAVIFHARHLTKDQPVPKYRPPGQKWIFYESEPPPQTWNRVKVLQNVWDKFNFTTTYTDNSDMRHSFYRLVCKPIPDWTPKGLNYAENKTKLAAWWVSHCESDSQREVYVAEMKNYMEVDIMGKCGAASCSTYLDGPNCVQELLQNKYKFYLAFENSFCKEYYTEKISKCLSVNVIPVVMGLFNYSELLPKGSYIDVRDFKGPKYLAEYLLYLDRNNTAYNEYIENKSRIQCDKLDQLSYSCLWCRYLWENRHLRQVAPDTRHTFGINQQCVSPKMFFRDIGEGIHSRLKTQGVFDSAGTDTVWDSKYDKY